MVNFTKDYSKWRNQLNIQLVQLDYVFNLLLYIYNLLKFIFSLY